MRYWNPVFLPKLFTLVNGTLPKLERERPFIFSAFVTALQGNRAFARTTLTVNTGPYLRERRLTSGNRAIGGIYTGVCPEGDKDVVYLQQGYFADYESGALEEAMMLRLVLHEAVHWARDHLGLSQDIHGLEAGHYFEYISGLDPSLPIPRDHMATCRGGPPRAYAPWRT